MWERSATAAAAIMLLLAACSTVPVQHVEGYSEAFDQASVAGNQLYDGISAKVIQEQAIADAQAQQVAATPAATANTVIMPAAGPADERGLSAGWRLERALSGMLRSGPVRARPAGRRAGQPARPAPRARDDHDVQRDRLAPGVRRKRPGARCGGAAAGVECQQPRRVERCRRHGSPLIGLTTDLAARLATWAETLRADQELRAALDAGSPLIEQLLVALINDTSTMYALKREEVAAQLVALKVDAREIEFDIADVMRAHAAPQGPMVAELARRDLRYNNARERMGLAFQSLAALAGPGGQPFTEQTLDQIDEQVAQLEAFANQYQEQVLALNRYYEALGEYVAMLHEVDATLATVTASARAPQAVTISPRALSQQATEIRDQAREIQKLLDT